MISRLPVLAGLLIAQLALLSTIGLLGNEDAEVEPFLSFELEQITGFTIADGAEQLIELKRGAQGWHFSGTPDVPADADKIAEVLEKLSNLGSPWPVATSAASRTRFEVTQDNYQRNIRLATADSLQADFYLGTSPGYRRVHARNAGDDDVYSVDFANFEVPVVVDEWLDKTLLQTQDITAITLTDSWSLTRSEAGWLLDGEPADQANAQRMVDRIADLRVLGQHESLLDAAVPGRSVRVTDLAGEYLLTVRQIAADGDYAVASDRLPGSYRLASYVAEQILVEAGDLAPAADLAPAEPDAADGNGLH